MDHDSSAKTFDAKESMIQIAAKYQISGAINQLLNHFTTEVVRQLDLKLK